MKKLLTLSLFILGSITAFSQTPLVYFDFCTHNEETTTWNGATYYANNRAKLITLANYFQTNGITWNMQSDWTYLDNVILQDGPLMGTTAGKNILRWMYEDKGVEMDPHGHETQYTYPDLVKLMDSIGLPESKIMGGTLYAESNGINVWMNLINGQYGNMFPTKFWAPDYMMGGGTPGHVADLDYYGFWNPQDTVNYLTHYPANHLRHFGIGCSIKIKNTDTVSVIVGQIKDLMTKVQTGQYPSSGFYFQTIFFEQGDLNNSTFYNKVLEVADSVNAIVATGAAQWKTMKQGYTEWETTYAAQVFQHECGAIVSTDVSDAEQENLSTIYPNPFSNSATLEITNPSQNFVGCDLRLFDILGKEIRKQEIKSEKTEIQKGDLPNGIYFYQVKNSKEVFASGKLVVQ